MSSRNGGDTLWRTFVFGNNRDGERPAISESGGSTGLGLLYRRWLCLGMFGGTVIATLLFTQFASSRKHADGLLGNLRAEEGVDELRAEEGVDELLRAGGS
jgi:hypothetical protein